MPVIELTTYRPATYRGRVLRLHCARAEELEPWLDLVAAQGEVHVQFWLKPGDPPVALEPGEAAPPWVRSVSGIREPCLGSVDLA